MNTRTQRIFAMLLALIMVISLIPMQVFAAENEPIVLIGGGDYQQAGDHANSSSNVTDILDQIVAAGLDSVDGFLFIGDYDCETHDDSTETAAGITSLMNTMTSVYSNLDYDNTILVQGNHDYKDSRIDTSGGHTFDGYSVFVMNEDDYPNYGGSESQAKSLSSQLDTFLADKLAEGYTAPIFVTSHVPLHFGPRTNKQGDGKYAAYYFDVLNAYGAEGLNIIFMHGHNHAYGYDEYLGGEAIYLAKGDSINIAQTGSQSSYNTYTLNFTYMNAGYTGYYNESGYSTSSGTDFLTMTTFQIYEDRVVIGRYNADGIYNLKTAGEKKGDYISSVSVSANTAVYSSTQTVNLGAPAERITLEDAATGVAVTGVKVEGSFDDASDLTVSVPQSVEILDNSAKCAEYKAYELAFTSDEAVKIALPAPEGFETAKVYRVEDNALTEMDATIENGVASFTATEGGLYALVREVSISASAGVYYQRVESVSQLVSGEQYLIVFDCSSQTTADAIVMPTIVSYSSGSSLRKGPDVLVSDGLADDATFTGSYDDYLWTLTKSGSGWLIGNGSQNINVTYNSTSSRCELDLTSSGEALTIATASSNPSDADSYSFAISDSSGYYWQYNTSATLIYGTTSDSYSSRFCFYKRVENTAEDTQIPNGWVELPSGGTYVLDTDGVEYGEDNKYIIVGQNNNYALTLSGGAVGAQEVTISNNTITLDDPSVVEFYFADNSGNESGSYLLTQDGSNSIYHANGNMYYGADNKGYWHFASSSNGAYQLYDTDNSKWYLNYGYVWSSESVSRFAVSSNTRYVRLFKAVSSVYGDSYVRLAGQTQQEYASNAGVTLADVLGSLFVQTTNDGYTISQTIAVTEDMVSWDKTFSGSTAGTYTGTVTYEGMTLGSVVVTINTIAHEYKTVTVEPTCTEDGSITTTCTICGDSTVEVIEATGHDYTCVTTEATCGADGSQVYTCDACGDSYSVSLPATGKHSYSASTVAATCTEEGKTVYTCATCGDRYEEIIAALGHNYAAVVTAPTCIAAGYTTYTCACGDSYVSNEVAALGHSYTAVTVEATCTADGSVTYTCACGHSYAEVIAALGHSYKSVVTAPTCTTDGYTTHTCTACGDSYTSDTVAALGHNYAIEVVDATCTEGGYVAYNCSVCGDGYIHEQTAALGHSYAVETVEATCTTGGYTTHTCATCGDSYIFDVVAALGHDNEVVSVAATCTEAGSITTTCTVCGERNVEVIAALGHDYDAVVTAPTCTEGGYTTYTCVSCGESHVAEQTAALGHSYTAVTVEATCTEEGSVTYTCACGDSYEEVIAALGHNYNAVVTAPTCVEAGYTTYTCVCGDSYVADEVAALGHNYNAVVTAPTCTEDGYTAYTCVCGDSYVADEVAALGHNYNAVVTAPTCTEDGYTTYTCVCGDSYISDEVAALGHNYNAVVTAPTCTAEGYTTYTCACGDSYISDEVAALGHDYETVTVEATCTEAGSVTDTCTVCGHTVVETIASRGHSYSAAVTAPTCTSGGYTTYTCTVCGDSYVANQTAALDHTYTGVESDGYMVYTCTGCGDSYSEQLSHTYTKVSSIASGNGYVITLYSGNKYYALTHKNNTLSVTQVTVSNNQITSEITEDMVWDYANSKLSYTDDGTTYYLYASSSSSWWGNWFGSTTLSLSTSNSSTVSFSNSKLKIGSKYLRYSSGKISLSSSSTKTYFFIEE